MPRGHKHTGRCGQTAGQVLWDLARRTRRTNCRGGLRGYREDRPGRNSMSGGPPYSKNQLVTLSWKELLAVMSGFAMTST